MTTLSPTTQEQLRISGPRQEAPAASGLTFGDFVGIIQRYIVMIIILSIIFGALAVGGWILWLRYFPSYESIALIQCISESPSNTLEIQQNEAPKDVMERFMESQARIIKAPDVLDLALQTPEVQATTWYKQADPDRRRLALDEDLHSGWVRGTNFVQVKMGCRDKKDPRVIVDQVVRNYLSKVLAEGVSEYQTRLRSAQRESDLLLQKIDDKRKQIIDFATNNLEPGALSEGNSPLMEQQIELAKQVAIIEGQLNEIEPLYQMYFDSSRPPDFGEEMRQVESDPQVAALAYQKLQLEQLLDLTASRFGTGHREYRDQMAQLETVDKKLTEFREQRLNELITANRESVAVAISNLRQQLLRANEQLLEISAKQRDFDRKLVTYEQEVKDLELMEERYKLLGESINELERVVTNKSAIRVEIAQRPVDPIERSQPKLLYLPAGLFVAFLMAVGFALLRHFLDTSVRTPTDIVRHLTIGMLGSIPDLDDEEMPIEQIETAVRDNPHSMVAEAFRAVRTNLQFTAPADRQRTVVVTSPQPEDGKTTVATNLAALVSMSGRRVLMIDANFRRPKLHEFFDGAGNDGRGLSDYLVGTADLQSVIQKTDLPYLDLISTGHPPPNPAELLGSQFMRRLLDEASQTYDQVFIDTAPVLVATDALVLSTVSHGVILVCRAKQNSRGVAIRACRMLTHVNARIFGAVLNAVQVHRGGYFREQLRTYYDYIESTQNNNEPPRLPSGKES